MDSDLEARLAALEERLPTEPEIVKKKPGRVVDEVLDALDRGELRVAEPQGEDWVVNAWVKRAILLSFARYESVNVREVMYPRGPGLLRDAGYLPSYYDKLPTKRNWKKLGARCVPPGVARYGSYLGRGAILMPGFVNIGAYVDDGTMVDTWATVGSCAQIGRDVHLSGGVGIGGVLEPMQALPVIVEDGAFVGSRCVVVEGVRVGARGGAGRGRGADRLDPGRRRARPRAADHQGRDPGPGGRDPGHIAQALPGRRVRHALRADHRRAQRLDRPQDLAQRRPARVRGGRMNEPVADRAQSHPSLPLRRCEVGSGAPCAARGARSPGRSAVR